MSATTSFFPRLVKAIWLAILLGILVQLLVVLAAGVWPKNLLADTVQKVSWSVFVCSALAIGNVVSKSRELLVGLIGMLAAPGAFHAARTIQKSLTQGTSGAGAGGIPTITELAMAKAVQYALFGLCIAYASKRGKLSLHLCIGVVAGIAMATYLSLRIGLGNDPTPSARTIFPRAVF